MIEEADYVIADSGENLKELKKEFGSSIKNSIAIPPYDSREDSGISQQFDVQKILVAIDDIEEKELSVLVRLLGEYLLTNENARIYLFTRKSEYDRKQKVLKQVQIELENVGMEDGWAAEEGNAYVSENRLESEEDVSVKFFVEQCVDELAVSKCMREQRLFVDLRKIPELYLQITAISFGIPQIVLTPTEFIKDGKNGMILKNIFGLPEALSYYLEGLKNWNQARIYSYELVKEFTTEKLLEKWKEVMDSVGKDSCFTVGKSRLE